MGALSVNVDAPGVARRHQGPVVGGKVSDPVQIKVVQGKNGVAWKTLKETLLDHLQSASFSHLFSGLKNKIHTAIEIRLGLGQVPGRGQEHGGVTIMTTRVHATIVLRAVGKVIVLL